MLQRFGPVDFIARNRCTATGQAARIGRPQLIAMSVMAVAMGRLVPAVLMQVVVHADARAFVEFDSILNLAIVERSSLFLADESGLHRPCPTTRMAIWTKTCDTGY